MRDLATLKHEVLPKHVHMMLITCTCKEMINTLKIRERERGRERGGSSQLTQLHTDKRQFLCLHNHQLYDIEEGTPYIALAS